MLFRFQLILRHSSNSKIQSYKNMSSETNENSEVKVLLRAFEILRWINYAPKKGEQFTLYLFLKFSIPPTALIIIPFIGIMGHLYMTTQVPGLLKSEQMDDLCLIVEFCTFSGFSMAGIIVGNKLIVLHARLSEYKFGKPKDIEIVIKRHDFLANLLFYSVIVTGMIYCTQKFIQDSHCDGKKLVNDLRFICGLPAPAWFPINFESIAIKLVIFLSEFLVVVIYMPRLSMSCVIIWGTIELIVMRVKHLRSKLDKIDISSDPSIDNNCRDQLKFCILYHDEIASLVQLMNDSLSHSMLVQYFWIPLNFALLEFQTIQRNDIASALHLAVWLGVEYLLCMSGQLIETESLKLIDSVYSIKWYEMPLDIKHDFYILLARVQNPFKLRVGPLIHINNEFLYMVLKGSYTFLMYLNSF